MKRLEYRRAVVGYYTAKRVALLYDAGSDGRLPFINKIIKNLERDGKKVMTLGYFDQKRIPEGVSANERVNFFSKNSFSLMMRPKSEAVRNFIDHPHDLLIDLTVRACFLVKFVAGITKATYKAGEHHPDYLSVYDLLLQVDEQTTDQTLADHAIHYLKIIKTPEK